MHPSLKIEAEFYNRLEIVTPLLAGELASFAGLHPIETVTRIQGVKGEKNNEKYKYHFPLLHKNLVRAA